MKRRKEAIERVAHFLVANESLSARKVAAEICSLYEQTVGLRPDTQTLIQDGKFVKAERWVTQFETIDQEAS